MKIAYIYSTMATKGGTERMITEKANLFAEQYGYDVTIINCFQHADEANFYKLSTKVKQIFLEVPYFSQYKYKYPKRLWMRWKMNGLLKKSIRQAVIQIDPDILIGISRFRANFISTLKCRAKKTIECHVARPSTVNFDRGDQSIIKRMYMKIYELIYLNTMEKNADAIIALTEEDKLLYKRAKYKLAIPNFSTMNISQISDCTQKRIIAVGHLQWIKGFGRLIEIWSIVSIKHPDWHLDIFGEGDMYETLRMLIRIHKVTNVSFHNCTSNISQEYAKSSICAVTSYYEGFSLVTLEAMKHGVPCVAFDCPYGPRSIINDAQCGFLVENGETRIFADRLCRLIEDEGLRQDFSKASIEKAKTFNVDIIMNKWNDLYKELCGNPKLN